jgi:predicted metal-binding membrane protein
MCAMKLKDVNDQMALRPAGDCHAPVIWPWLLVLTAWTLALLAVLTNQNYLINHHYLLEESHLPLMVALFVFLGCWQVMTAGMMLPSSMPMVSMLVRASRQQRHPRTLQLTFLAGYTLIWTGFALLAFLSDTQIHRLAHSWFWLYMHSWLIGAVTLAIAGGFQFSPLKACCLKQCRSPFSFFASFYREGVGGAWRLGLRHGICCLGSCWALMLVMFGLGVDSLVTMAALTGVMVVEKTFPGGQRLSPVIGIVLIVLSAVWLVHPTWLSAAGV